MELPRQKGKQGHILVLPYPTQDKEKTIMANYRMKRNAETKEWEGSFIRVYEKDGNKIYMRFCLNRKTQRGSYDFYIQEGNQEYPNLPYVSATETKIENPGWARVFKDSVMTFEEGETYKIEDKVRKKKKEARKKMHTVGMSYSELLTKLMESINKELDDENKKKEFYGYDREGHFLVVAEHFRDILDEILNTLDADEKETSYKVVAQLKRMGIVVDRKQKKREGKNIWHYIVDVQEEK